ncbi:MAG: hypothetical protein WBE76_09780, partial [Terracidiphilus sp.]
QGLKPSILLRDCGTAEAVPFQNLQPSKRSKTDICFAGINKALRSFCSTFGAIRRGGSCPDTKPASI